MPLARLIPAVLFVGAAAYPLTYLLLASQRLTFPLELEWMEGATVAHVQRILDGQPIYTQPSLEFVPFLYSPLYYYVSSLVASVAGNGFFALRLVSLVSSLGCLALIFAIVRRRVQSALGGTLAVCLFAATYPLTGSWFDLARVDSLFLLFLLAGAWTFLSPRPLVRSVATPLLLFLAFFTKQSALVVVIGFSVAAAVTRPRWERVAVPAISGALVAGSSWLMNAMTDGWYGYYIYDLPRALPFPAMWPGDVWSPNLLGLSAVSIALAFATIALVRFPAGRTTREAIEDAAILGSLALVSYLSRVAGGYENVLMPLYAGVAIYGAIGFERVPRLLEPQETAQQIAAVALIVQFALLVYSPWAWLPTPAAREQGAALLARVAAIEGPVYWPDHPWYLRLAGKPTTGHEEAVGDVVLADPQGWGARLLADMAAAVAEKRFGGVVVDFESFRLRPEGFDAHYETADADVTGDDLIPPAGGPRRPTYLYVPRDRAPEPR